MGQQDAVIMQIGKATLRFFSVDGKLFDDYALKLCYQMEREAGPVNGETGIEGLRVDFRAGMRLEVSDGNWHVRLSDAVTDLILFEDDISGLRLISMEKYFIQWRVEVALDGIWVFSHTLELAGQKVYFRLGHALGDTIFLLPCLEAFGRRYSCSLCCSDRPAFSAFIETYYPQIQQVHEIPEDVYAVYPVGVYQNTPILSPADGRTVAPNLAASFQLGLQLADCKRKVLLPTAPRRIQEPYVCISVQASGINKCWLHPQGWNHITAYLRELGYRVLCIDGDKELKNDKYTVGVPEGAEDVTGRLPLTERINLLAYADFFIGGPSGLSWLAWAADCPVILISGITMPFSEFFTPYRVLNPLVCHGCYNDLRVDWKEQDCPYHHDTEREFECSRKITPYQVISMIEKLREDRGWDCASSGNL